MESEDAREEEGPRGAEDRINNYTVNTCKEEKSSRKERADYTVPNFEFN